jgi:2-polyprenyl-3-methyl-5-hydroxy-6-metoxy-1,4-benzoquinol methylase
MPRVLVGELMDDPALDPEEHAHALRGLARLNAMSRVPASLYPILRREAAKLDRPLTIADIATGSADVPVALLERAKRDGVRLDVTASDISERALETAKDRAAAANVTLHTQPLDVLRADFPRADVVMCSLFLHHLTDDQVATVLRKMAAAASRLVLVSDLRRGPWGTALSTIIPRLVTRSRVVHVDAPRSARAALAIDEVRAMTREIARHGVWSVEPAFPARMLIRWTPRESSTRS